MPEKIYSRADSAVEYVEKLIRVEVRPGSKFNDACQDAWDMANSHGMGVLFEFNGHEAIVYPLEDIEAFKDEFWKVCNQDGNFCYI